MNRIHQFLLAASMIALLSFNSCKNNPLNCSTNFSYAAELADEAQALSVALQAYVQDQSTANCNAYAKAFEDYLKAASDLDNCVPQAEREAYQQAIKEAEDGLDDLTC